MVSSPEAAVLAREMGLEALGLARTDEEARRLAGHVGRVYVVRSGSVAEAIVTLYRDEGFALAVLPGTREARDAAAHAAQLIGAAFVPDAVNVALAGDKFRVERLVLGNKAVAVYEAHPPLLLTLGPGSRPVGEGSAGGEIRELSVGEDRRVRSLSVEEKPKGAVRLEDAEIIVSVGRGFKKKEDLQLAFHLAEVLGAQVGCSRPIAADLKWLPEEHWVGLSGKKVSPRLYLAVGISGQAQHIAGILNSKYIAAINSDPNAPIFQYVDFGIVDDLYKVLPLLAQRLKERLGRA